MTVLVTALAMLTSTPTIEPPTVRETASSSSRPRPALVYGHAGKRRARRQLDAARWYLRRHRATRPHRAWLARLRQCESTDRYGTNTGNGYFGAYQFDLQTWASVGGRGLPSSAAPIEQDYRAVVLLRRRGTAPWPVCGGVTMRGVILDGELYGSRDDAEAGETVHVFVELENGFVHVRRGYGTRAAVLTFELDAVDAALDALRREAERQPAAAIPGQLELDEPEPTDDVDHSDAT